MIGIRVIGYGHWGPNLVRNFSETPGGRVAAVYDLREENLAKVRRRYPAVKTTDDWRELQAMPDVHAVAIATPVSSHFEIGLEALRCGKHLLVEKPMAERSAQAMQPTQEAAARRLVLMIDHTFCFTGAVQKTRELIASGELGKIYYYDSGGSISDCSSTMSA